jgi:DNA-binding MarR family transcriptional regulator
MNQVTKPNLPIGCWLKQADKLLTEKINEVQAANGVSRSEWQVLNLICEAGSASQERIFKIMRTFVDAPSLDEIIRHLRERGWVEQRGDPRSDPVKFRLTEEGQRQHETSLASQKDIRQRAMQGISEGEYATVIRVLQQLVCNLEGDIDG